MRESPQKFCRGLYYFVGNAMKNDIQIIPGELVESKIYLFRGQKVMIDHDLAFLYAVPTKVLKQAVVRNAERFPSDFMFELTKEEMEIWRAQFVATQFSKMGSRRPPLVFTEQGVAMLSGVLKSPRAVAVNIQIFRTFSRLREMLAENDDLRRKVEALEKQYDENFKIVFDAIRNMIADDAAGRSEIGFRME